MTSNGSSSGVRMFEMDRLLRKGWLIAILLRHVYSYLCVVTFAGSRSS